LLIIRSAASPLHYHKVHSKEKEEEMGGKNTTGGTVFHPKDGGSRFPPDTNVTTQNTMI